MSKQKAKPKSKPRTKPKAKPRIKKLVCTIKISTTAKNGSLLVYVIRMADNVRLLSVSGNTTGSCTVQVDIKYRIEWHTWSVTAADYSYESTVTPDNACFTPNPYSWKRSYDMQHDDYGGKEFKLC